MFGGSAFRNDVNEPLTYPQSSQAKISCLSKLVNLEASSSKSGYQWVLLPFLIFATTITEIATDMCPDSSFNDDWLLYLKDKANPIDLQLSLIVDFADTKKVVEENRLKP